MNSTFTLGQKRLVQMAQKTALAYTGTHLFAVDHCESQQHSLLGVVPASVQSPGRGPLVTSLRTMVQTATVYLCIWSGLGFVVTLTTSLTLHLVSVNIAFLVELARALLMAVLPGRSTSHHSTQ